MILFGQSPKQFLSMIWNRDQKQIQNSQRFVHFENCDSRSKESFTWIMTNQKIYLERKKFSYNFCLPLGSRMKKKYW